VNRLAVRQCVSGLANEQFGAQQGWNALSLIMPLESG
jgi:hypothetical protein